MTWYFSKLPALCVAVAAIELDDVHVGQWMVSRPFIIGPGLGWIMGDAWLGTRIGILLELMTIDDLAVGNALPLNATLATAFTVIFAAGPAMVPAAIALPGGLLVGAAFRYVEGLLRAWRAQLTAQVEAAIDAGRRISFPRIFSQSLLWHLAAAGAFLYMAVMIFAEPIQWAGRSLPYAVRYGLDAAFELAPWLGFATLMRSFQRFGS